MIIFDANIIFSNYLINLIPDVILTISSKRFAVPFASPLYTLFNESLISGTVTFIWENAHVTRLHKSGSKSANTFIDWLL